MFANEDVAVFDELIDLMVAAAEADDAVAIKSLTEDLNPAEIAHLLEGIRSDNRSIIFQAIDPELQGDVLLELGEVAAESLAGELDVESLRKATQGKDSSDIAELFDVFPDETVEAILEDMSAQRRQRIEQKMAYEEDSAGRLMQSDAINIRPDVSVETVLRYIRFLDEVPDDIVVFMVVDRFGKFKGTVKVLELLRAQPDTLISSLMDKEAKTLHPNDDENEVAFLFESHDLISVPVVSDEDLFLGRVVIDDVVDIIREQGEEALFGLAGLDDEEDLFAPLIPSAKRRAVWLALNLATAFLAAWVIGLFEGALEQIVALAILMPIVASMGGIAGTQTLTLTIRGLALGQIGRSNTRTLFTKEAGISLLNGLLWAVVVGFVTWLWFGQIEVGMVLGVALVLNMTIAAMAGIAVPLFLQKMNLDPALSGAVIVTTITDVVGFISFLGLATLFLL